MVRLFLVIKSSSSKIPFNQGSFRFDGDHNLIKGNYISAELGIDMGGNNNWVIENTATRSEIGHRIGGEENLIKNNIITNSFWGLLVGGNNNQIINNISNNNVYGIFIANGFQDNTIFGNVALRNGTIDMRDDNLNCGNNRWKNNVFKTSKPEDCIH